jgi:hypothetical protein
MSGCYPPMVTPKDKVLSDTDSILFLIASPKDVSWALFRFPSTFHATSTKLVHGHVHGHGAGGTVGGAEGFNPGAAGAGGSRLSLF